MTDDKKTLFNKLENINEDVDSKWNLNGHYKMLEILQNFIG